MPSTPYLSAKLIVPVLSALVAVVAARVATSMRGFPGRPHRWPLVLLRRVVTTLRRPSRETVSWVGLGLYSAGVTALHVEGLVYHIYTAVAWWDLLTHTLSGFGVGAALYLTLDETTDRPAYWVVPSVLAFGAGFEVYEYVIRDFWFHWSLQVYLVDTVTDLAVGTVGAALFLAFVEGARAVKSTASAGVTAPKGSADPLNGPNAHRTDGSGARER